jgi:hypothetical protein
MVSEVNLNGIFQSDEDKTNVIVLITPAKFSCIENWKHVFYARTKWFEWISLLLVG